VKTFEQNGIQILALSRHNRQLIKSDQSVLATLLKKLRQVVRRNGALGGANTVEIARGALMHEQTGYDVNSEDGVIHAKGIGQREPLNHWGQWRIDAVLNGLAHQGLDEIKAINRDSQDIASLIINAK
jgi:hypothetical protein